MHIKWINLQFLKALNAGEYAKHQSAEAIYS